MSDTTIIQIHWQKSGVGNEHITEFVVQASLREMDAKGINHFEWIASQIESKMGSCPRGWRPILIWGNHPRMFMGATEQ